jgi:hypothetical protein
MEIIIKPEHVSQKHNIQENDAKICIFSLSLSLSLSLSHATPMRSFLAEISIFSISALGQRNHVYSTP